MKRSPSPTRKKKWKMPKWMEPYREMFANTGGNVIEELMNDKDTNSFNNSIRAALICCVDSQVILLHRLKDKGLLVNPIDAETRQMVAALARVKRARVRASDSEILNWIRSVGAYTILQTSPAEIRRVASAF